MVVKCLQHATGILEKQKIKMKKTLVCYSKFRIYKWFGEYSLAIFYFEKNMDDFISSKIKKEEGQRKRRIFSYNKRGRWGVCVRENQWSCLPLLSLSFLSLFLSPFLSHFLSPIHGRRSRLLRNSCFHHDLVFFVSLLLVISESVCKHCLKNKICTWLCNVSHKSFHFILIQSWDLFAAM